MTQSAWLNFDVGNWSPRRAMPVSLLKQIIERHAPIIHFHPEEVYFPSTIDWYLARALLVDQSTGAVILKHPKSTSKIHFVNQGEQVQDDRHVGN